MIQRRKDSIKELSKKKTSEELAEENEMLKQEVTSLQSNIAEMETVLDSMLIEQLTEKGLIIDE